MGNRIEDKNEGEVTFQLLDLGRLVVDRKLGLGKGSEAGGVRVEELLEDLTSFFNYDLSGRAR